MERRNNGRAMWRGMLWAGAAVMLAQSAIAHAQAQAQDGAITAATLVDRAQIEDLLTRYYYNLGHGGADSFSRFYADDAGRQHL